jgi:hypothetical protein
MECGSFMCPILASVQKYEKYSYSFTFGKVSKSGFSLSPFSTKNQVYNYGHRYYNNTVAGVEKYRTTGPLVPENVLSSQKIFPQERKI